MIKERAARLVIYAIGVILSLLLIGSMAYRQCLYQPSIPMKTVEGLHLRLAGGELIPLPYNEPVRQIARGRDTLLAWARTLELKTINTGISAYAYLVVPAKLDYRVILSDSSKAWLNACSSLQFPFHFIRGSRHIHLKGEAFLSVKGNDRVFFVHTSAGVISTSKGKFNINAYKDNATVLSVLYDTVSIQTEGKPLVLAAGQQITFTQDGSYSIQPCNQNSIISWTNGRFYFNQQPLEEIVPVIERWFDMPAVFDDSTVGKVALGGMLNKHKPLNAFPKNLKLTGVMDYYIREDSVHFSTLPALPALPGRGGSADAKNQNG